MKVNYVSIYKVLLYPVIVLNLFKVGVVAELPTLISSLTLFIIYLSQKNKKQFQHGWIISFILLEIILFITQYERLKTFNPSNMTNFDVFNLYGGVYYLLFCFPLYEIISDDRQSFFKVIEKICIITLIIKTGIWIGYNFFNVNMDIFKSVIRPTWNRSLFGLNLTRVSGTFLDSIIVPYVEVKVLENRRKTTVLEFLFLLFYLVVITQTRMYLVATVVSFVIGYLFWSKGQINRHAIYALSLMSVLVLLILGRNMFRGFLNSFSVDSIEGGSTSTRLYEWSYYSSLWRSRGIWLGFGYQLDYTLFGGIRYYLSDLGITILLFQFGILGFLISIIPFTKGIFLSLKCLMRSFDTWNLLFVVISSYMLINILYMSPYIQTGYFFIPIYIALTLYTYDYNR